MNFPLRLRALALFSGLTLTAASAVSQSLQPRWQREFPDQISWYVRASPGILLVRVGTSLTAVDGVDGRVLWELPDIGVKAATGSGWRMAWDRGRNLHEVQGMGVLLLDRVKLPGDTDWRLIGINLTTGEKLWEQPQPDSLVSTIPIPGTRDAVLVFMRLQKKALAAEIASAIALAATPGGGPVPGYAEPVHFEIQRLDAVSGKVRWSTEYPRLLGAVAPGWSVIGDRLFLALGGRRLASLDLASGKVLWEEGFKPFANLISIEPLSFETADERLLVGLKDVRALDASTGQAAWEVDGLGKLRQIRTCRELVLVLGDSHLAAVDAKTGAERWRKKTNGHTSNLLWDQSADAILYTDGSGLHSVERTGGKTLLDASLNAEHHPQLISFAGPRILITYAPKQIAAYDFKAGTKLFDAGKPDGFFSSISLADAWPMPRFGEDFLPWYTIPPAEPGGDAAVEGGLLTPEWQSRVTGSPVGERYSSDAYESESETGLRKIWWLDSRTFDKVEFAVAGSQHDVSRSLGMIYIVEGKRLSGLAIPAP